MVQFKQLVCDLGVYDFSAFFIVVIETYLVPPNLYGCFMGVKVFIAGAGPGAGL